MSQGWLWSDTKQVDLTWQHLRSVRNNQHCHLPARNSASAFERIFCAHLLAASPLTLPFKSQCCQSATAWGTATSCHHCFKSPSSIVASQWHLLQCPAEVVGSRGQPFKNLCWSWTDKQPSNTKVSYRSPLPTNESISSIQPLPYSLNSFMLLKAWHWCLLTRWMKPEVANRFCSTTARLKHMLCFSMLNLTAQLLLAREMFQIYRKFTLWNLSEVGKISSCQHSQ